MSYPQVLPEKIFQILGTLLVNQLVFSHTGWFATVSKLISITRRHTSCISYRSIIADPNDAIVTAIFDKLEAEVCDGDSVVDCTGWNPDVVISVTYQGVAIQDDNPSDLIGYVCFIMQES